MEDEENENSKDNSDSDSDAENPSKSKVEYLIDTPNDHNLFLPGTRDLDVKIV